MKPPRLPTATRLHLESRLRGFTLRLLLHDSDGAEFTTLQFRRLLGRPGNPPTPHHHHHLFACCCVFMCALCSVCCVTSAPPGGAQLAELQVVQRWDQSQHKLLTGAVRLEWRVEPLEGAVQVSQRSKVKALTPLPLLTSLVSA